LVGREHFKHSCQDENYSVSELATEFVQNNLRMLSRDDRCF
jgi:hypothetical protein